MTSPARKSLIPRRGWAALVAALALLLLAGGCEYEEAGRSSDGDKAAEAETKGSGEKAAEAETKGSGEKAGEARKRASRSRAATGPGKPDRIAAVIDGDTVELASLGRARLIGIDTPEVHGRQECYGREASAYLKRLLPPGTRVTYTWDVERRDRYGRALVYLFRGGEMVNAKLARGGYAVPLTIPPNVRHAERFRRLAAEARRAGRGLWSASTCAGDADLPVGGSSRSSGSSRSASSGSGSGGSRPSGSAAGGWSGSLDGDRDCDDFSTQAEAQSYYEAKGGPASDPDNLDADRDGVACEALP
jgi:micrococcal nuclease